MQATPQRVGEAAQRRSSRFSTFSPGKKIAGIAEFLLILLTLCSSGVAYETLPWFPTPLQPLIVGAYRFQHFPELATTDPLLNVSETSHTGIGAVAFSPTSQWTATVEGALTWTNRSHTFFDYGLISGRYLLMDDVIGDPFSLSTGAAIIVSSDTSTQDFATYALSQVDFDFHVAVGKERACSNTWSRRSWAVGSILVPIRGLPQFRGKIATQFHQCGCIVIGAFVEALVGLGVEDLTVACPFRGYGTIQTRAIDVGAEYLQTINNWNTIGIEYRFRPYAHNYPQNAHQVTVALFIPFSL